MRLSGDAVSTGGEGRRWQEGGRLRETEESGLKPRAFLGYLPAPPCHQVSCLLHSALTEDQKKEQVETVWMLKPL